MPNMDIQGKVWNILNINDEYESDVPIDVETTNSAYSQEFFLPRSHTFAWEVQFDSDGAIDVKVELEQLFENDDEFVIPDNKVDKPMFTEITDSNTHQTAYSPIASFKGRLKITGLGANDATTQLIKAKMYTARNYG